MSFISLESVAVQSLDIMADSIDAKQMLLTLNSRLDWLNSLIFCAIQPLHSLTNVEMLSKGSLREKSSRNQDSWSMCSL